MSKILKNNTSSEISLDIGHKIPASGSYTIDPANYSLFARSNDVLSKLASEDLTYNDGNYDLSLSNAIIHLNGFLPTCLDANIESTIPFAEPTHRTKFTGIGSVITIQPDSSQDIDYLVPVERYVYGGQIIAKNAEFGDYITASMYDKDGIIPEAYRSALCESWPVIATYIEKHWLSLHGTNPHVEDITTYPLNAKVSAGLYMRLTYHACSSGSAREVLMNYLMVKKL